MLAPPLRGFEGQFLLSTNPLELTFAADRGATVTTLDSLSIACFTRLSQHQVYDADGRKVGVLLGYPIDVDRGVAVDGEFVLPSPLRDVDAFVEQDIYGLAGRFVFVLDDQEYRRVYLDACGSVPVVYDPETGLAASSTGLLLDAQAYRDRFASELYEHLHVRRDGWFPAGLTAHRGINRLLPNHYLDLQSMSTVRHWPKGTITATTEPDAACRRIVSSTRSVIDACLEAGPVAMSLTAGNETRLLLAAAREAIEGIETVTVDHREGRLDRVRAQELAERFNLRHTCLPVVVAGPQQAEDWHARAGHCLGGPNMRSHPTVAALSSFSFFLGGMGGEIGRGFFWRSTDTATTVIDASKLTRRFGMPAHDDVVRAVDGWLSGLPDQVDTFLQLDLAYLELRMGPWAFAQPPGTSPVRELHPLISRANFTAMLSLPPEWRSTNRMILRSIELHWPGLLELPINRFGDWRDPALLVQRALRQPHLIAKRLRKRLV